MPCDPSTEARLRTTCEQYIEVVAAGAANTDDRRDKQHEINRRDSCTDIAFALGPYFHEPIEVPEACGDELVMAKYDHPQAILYRGHIILTDSEGFRFIDRRLVLDLDDPESSPPSKLSKGAGKPELAEIAGPMAGA